jgi:hypothetical protein
MNRLHPFYVLIAATALLAGCVQPAPIVDSHMGQALTMIKAQQTINPEASRNADPVASIDGKAGKSGYDLYQKSFRAPDPQQNIFTIGIGK